MSDETPNDSVPAVSKEEELALLKQRARTMGIEVPNNIGVERLRARIQAKLDGDNIADANEAASHESEDTSGMSAREKSRRENMRLIRCRITCMNPRKKDLPGEVFTVANDELGTLRKFIPYGEFTDNGYHIPYWIYKRLKKRRFQQLRTVKNRNGRGEHVRATMVLEFAIEELPPLTPKELKELAQRQLATGTVNDEDNF